MQYFQIAVLVFVLFFPSGCVSGRSHSKKKPTLNVRVLFKGDQCGINRLNPHAIWIEDPGDFKKTYAQLTRYTIGTQQDLSSQVDFSREGILIAAMGLKTTGGYGLDLKQEFAVISDNTAVLSVFWIEPPKEAVLPQIITSPCLAISLPKGPYSQIQLLDQDARLRLKLPIE